MVTYQSGIFQAAAIAGPIGAGLLIAALPATWPVYLLTAAGCAAFAVAVASTRPRKAPRSAGALTPAAMLAGLSHMWRERPVFGAILLDMLAVIFGGATALLPQYADEILGGGPQLQALLGGHIDVGFNSIGELLVQHKAGAIRVIAVMDKSRSELLPEVPTTSEGGHAIEPIGSDIGLSAPAQTPRPILDRLSQAMRTIMQDPALKSRMLELGNTVSYLDAQGYATFWDAVDARFKPLIEAARQQAK